MKILFQGFHLFNILHGIIDKYVTDPKCPLPGPPADVSLRDVTPWDLMIFDMGLRSHIPQVKLSEVEGRQVFVGGTSVMEVTIEVSPVIGRGRQSYFPCRRGNQRGWTQRRGGPAGSLSWYLRGISMTSVELEKVGSGRGRHISYPGKWFSSLSFGKHCQAPERALTS